MIAGPASGSPRDGAAHLLVRKVRSAVGLVYHRGGRALRRVGNLSLKRGRHYRSRTTRFWRIVAEMTKNARLATRNVLRLALRRALNLRKPFIRVWRRSRRWQQQLASRRAEWAVEREIDRLVDGSLPIVLGPWFSEVGFEILYWVPFLQWLKTEYNLAPQRLIAVSRGGVASWYHGIAGTYVEIFDYLDPHVLAARNESRRHQTDGSRKQLVYSDLDEEILAHVRQRLGLGCAKVCHPSLMYRLFRQFWLGHRSLAHVQHFTRYVRKEAQQSVDLDGVPSKYVAAKFYAAESLPDEPATRQILRSLVARVADQVPVVLLDTGLGVDDHSDYVFQGHGRVYTVRHLMTPQNNLAVQTQIIGRAAAFIGTCGSLTWLAPMMGVDTVAVLSDERFLHGHLYVARQAYRAMNAGKFMTIDVGAIDHLGLTFITTRADPVASSLMTPAGPDPIG